MEIEISLDKSVDENAGSYFEKAKKAKAKLEGARKALDDSKSKLDKLLKEESKFIEEEKKKEAKLSRKREWYEKFHWFLSSEGFLCIGGKDATSNEIIIKKHLDKEDLVFHTDMAGSPFFIIKEGQKAGEQTIKECAQAVAVYSKAWKLGHGTVDVFYVKPEQVSKEAQSGEFLAKGSFMITGKTNYLRPSLEYAIGLVKENESKGIDKKKSDEENESEIKHPEIIGGPVDSIKKQTENYVIVIPGREKKSVTAKKIRSKLKEGDLDEITKFLPSGGAEVKKGRKEK